jgi:23S rRNA (cytosine1962-C5)-methyltransferase
MKRSWVKLKKGRTQSIERCHPWIFSGAIGEQSEGVQEGDLVDILSHDGDVIAKGGYASGSLAVKILSFSDEEIDATWFTQRLADAAQLRAQLGLPSAGTNCFRLMHGEGDSVPGLIIDVYDETAVIQPHSAFVERHIDWVVQGLLALGYKHMLHKPVGKEKPHVLHGKVSGRIKVSESSINYHVDVLQGQKTGFFLDQRDSRYLLQTLSKSKRVLNVFSYTGGFSMAALKGGAAKVWSVDASQHALDVAEENAQINAWTSAHTTLKVDAVPFLETIDHSWDIIVLDPPAFAKHKSARHSAIQAYRRINQAALAALPKGGLLMTFSCSQVVDRHMFDQMVLSAAMKAGKQVQILQKLRQPCDHPVALAHPEGEYLKGLLLRVV